MNPLTPKFPHMLHGGDYNPDQWLDRPDILEADIRLMKEAHINCVSVAIFAWAKLEPEEGRYEFDWLEKVIDNLYENGIYTVLATPSGSKPLWMSEKYPEIRRVSASLHRDQSGGRHNHCYTSPVYREKVRLMNTALAQRFSKHPGVILWHLSNEYGGECCCPLCQAAFREWLKEKYGTLEALNHAWWNDFWAHTVTDWEQIHAPGPEGEDGAFIQHLDWKRFVTHQVVDFVKAERDAVKAVDPSIPCTTNFMYYHNDYNYFKFKDELDVICWDAYPQWRGGNNAKLASIYGLWHDAMRSIKRQPFLLMESTPSTANWWPVSKLKKPGQHRMSSMQAVAHGSNSVQYFQFRKSRGAFEKFHGAVVDHQGGTEPREFQDVKAMGQLLERIDAVTQSDVHAQVALVFDWENRWAIDDAQGPRNKGMHYVEQVQAHYRALWRMGISVDIVDEECDISGYKLVIAPMLYLLREGFEETAEGLCGPGRHLDRHLPHGHCQRLRLDLPGRLARRRPDGGVRRVEREHRRPVGRGAQHPAGGGGKLRDKGFVRLDPSPGGPGAGHLRPGFLQGRGRPHREPVREGPGLLHRLLCRGQLLSGLLPEAGRGAGFDPRPAPAAPRGRGGLPEGKRRHPVPVPAELHRGEAGHLPAGGLCGPGGQPRRGGCPGPVRQPSVPAEKGVNPGKIPGGNHKTDGKNRRKIGGYGKIKKSSRFL